MTDDPAGHYATLERGPGGGAGGDRGGLSPQGAGAASGRPGDRRRCGVHPVAGRPTTCWATAIAAPPTTALPSPPPAAGRRSPSRSPAGPRLADLPVALWAGFGGLVFVVGLTTGGAGQPPRPRPQAGSGRRTRPGSPPQRVRRSRSSACQPAARPPTTCGRGAVTRFSGSPIGDAHRLRAGGPHRRVQPDPAAPPGTAAWPGGDRASPMAAAASLTRPG